MKFTDLDSNIWTDDLPRQVGLYWFLEARDDKDHTMKLIWVFSTPQQRSGSSYPKLAGKLVSCEVPKKGTLSDNANYETRSRHGFGCLVLDRFEPHALPTNLSVIKRTHDVGWPLWCAVTEPKLSNAIIDQMVRVARVQESEAKS